jgi:hypothetical protein
MSRASAGGAAPPAAARAAARTAADAVERAPPRFSACADAGADGETSAATAAAAPPPAATPSRARAARRAARYAARPRRAATAVSRRLKRTAAIVDSLRQCSAERARRGGRVRHHQDRSRERWEVLQRGMCVDCPLRTSHFSIFGENFSKFELFFALTVFPAFVPHRRNWSM